MNDIEQVFDPDSMFRFYRELQSYVQWGEDDRQRIQAAKSLVEDRFADLVDDFYFQIQQTPQAAKVIRGGEQQIERLKKTLLNWIQEFFDGNFDRDYVTSRWQVGRRHVMIGLDQTYANVALARLGQGMIASLMDNWTGDREELQQTIKSLNKLLHLEMAIITAAYQAFFAEDLNEQAKRQIEQSERLALIGQMITGLAHESRNALQRSHACLEALMLDVEEMPDASRQAKRIQGALDRLQMLYEEVRNYAAPINLELGRVDIEKLARSIWANLESSWSAKDVRIKWDLDTQEPLLVQADRFRLDQVFTNLFQNAIDASPEQGEIVFQVEKDPPWINLKIRNQGQPLPEDDAKRVFEPFFTTKHKGTGLGLAITKRIMDAHGAKIQLSSSKESGTELKISFRDSLDSDSPSSVSLS